MKLKEYIKQVIESVPSDTLISFEINLYSDGSVADIETGNKVSFEVYKKSQNGI